MTQKFWYSISFYLICLICPAQIYDNFTYADLKSDSCFWSGQVDSFQINADYQLQLNAHQGNAYLSRTLPHLQRLEEWNFWIALNFSPSENNQLRIYLAADSVVL